jgi:hypothetical protein
VQQANLSGDFPSALSGTGSPIDGWSDDISTCGKNDHPSSSSVCGSIAERYAAETSHCKFVK